jgi:hypothetical protein
MNATESATHTHPGAGTGSLASVIGAMENGVDPDVAVRRLSLRLEGKGTVVPEAYLVPPRSSVHLLRAEAARLLDTAARACVDAQGLGTRLAVITAHRLRSQRAYERLGYRTDADYAREELGISPREFRDMARLGGRLEALPAIRRWFIDQRLSRTQTEVVSRIAIASDEEEWIARAEGETVRGLKAAVRAAREQRSDEREASEPRCASAAIAHDEEDLPRRRRTFDLPAELLGKIDAVLELAARVAGADLPPGTLWEMIAADYLSGVSPLPDGGEDRPDGGVGGSYDAGAHRSAAARPGADTRSCTESDPGADPHPDDEAHSGIGGHAGAGMRRGNDAGSATGVSGGAGQEAAARAGRDDGDRCAPTRTQHPPEDPHGHQIWLERESRCWPWLPRAKARLELHGDWKELRRRCLADEPRSPWELHDDMQAALATERRVAWQIARLLVLIRNRRLWRALWFASFAHYVTERLGISVRVAERLIRVDREAWNYGPMLRAWQAGALSPLVADALVRVLPHVRHDPSIQQAWIDYARHTTFERLRVVIRAAERMRDEMPAGHKRALRSPEEVERAMVTGTEPPMFVTGGGPPLVAATGGRPPMFVTGEHPPLDSGAARDHPPMFVNGAGATGVQESSADVPRMARYAASNARSARGNAPYVVWMTGDELEILQRAIAHVRRACAHDGGAPPADSACLEVLLDAFVQAYADVAAAMRASYPLFERDGWRCRVPGCSAHGPLHLHHIVFRAHGGGDEPENLVTLCAFHHKALHDGWIRCVGRAPDGLYWELGTGPGNRFGGVPVARIAGHRRLAANEYWDGVRVGRMEDSRGVA